ncbi:unnamed protein product, partial [Mesorhabditis belari]|uniref:Tetraspanin n=1 Tax=Mesorhabditis belari TaxID=2138241 RepID=A0AAF3ERT1_9BILA
MVYGCGNRCVKLLFFLVNLLICIFGALVFGFSLWANVDKNFSQHLSDFIRNIDQGKEHHIDDIAKYQASLWVLVGVGIILFLVGFLGCCGAACESPVLLSLFFFIVVICTILELAATIFALVNKEKFVDSLGKVMEKCGNEENLRTALKPIQEVFHCCGATASTKHFFVDGGLCPGELATKSDCFDVLQREIEESGETIVVIAFILVAVQIASLFFSCILCRASREVRYAGYYA